MSFCLIIIEGDLRHENITTELPIFQEPNYLAKSDIFHYKVLDISNNCVSFMHKYVLPLQ